jgi:hypothetical protein
MFFAEMEIRELGSKCLFLFLSGCASEEPAQRNARPYGRHAGKQGVQCYESKFMVAIFGDLGHISEEK